MSFAQTQHEIAAVLRRQGKLVEALALLEVVARMQVAAIGSDHVNVAKTELEMALLLGRLHRLDQSLTQLKAVAQTEATAG